MVKRGKRRTGRTEFVPARPRDQVIVREAMGLKSVYLLKSRMIRIHQITYLEKNGDALEKLARNNELWSLQDHLLCKWSLLLWQ